MKHSTLILILLLFTHTASAQFHFSGGIGRSTSIAENSGATYSYYKGDVKDGVEANATMAYGDTLGIALTGYVSSNEMNYPSEFANGSQDQNHALLFGPFVQYDLGKFSFRAMLQGGVNYYTASEFSTTFLTEDMQGNPVNRRHSYEEYSGVEYGLMASVFTGFKVATHTRLGIEVSYFQSQYNTRVFESYVDLESGTERRREDNYIRMKRLVNFTPTLIFTF